MVTTTATLEPNTTTTDLEKLERGISAILRAVEDAKAGRLVCNCPECLARKENS